jgi:hypothetical protein
MFLISAVTEELFIDETPADSQLVARITYVFRDDVPDDVVEFYTAADFMSIVNLNGTNLFKIRADYTTRLVSNINAFVNGGEIINDF